MEHEISQLLQRYPVLDGCAGPLMQAFATLSATFAGGGKLLVCGNGGSAADSEHIVGELMKGFLRPRVLPASLREWLTDSGEREIGPRLASGLQGALPALSLCGHPALQSAIANDNGAEFVFAQQVYGLGREGDAFLGISTSGNSPNVLYALETARVLGMQTIALTGRSGGALAARAGIALRVPADTVVAIQELHLPVYHALCSALERRFFGE